MELTAGDMLVRGAQLGPPDVVHPLRDPKSPSCQWSRFERHTVIGAAEGPTAPRRDWIIGIKTSFRRF